MRGLSPSIEADRLIFAPQYIKMCGAIIKIFKTITNQ
nr:MAG TPA: hypothetical protein [Caudoviricetes sp.]